MFARNTVASTCTLPCIQVVFLHNHKVKPFQEATSSAAAAAKKLPSMGKISCPPTGCDFQAEDQEASVVAVPLRVHASTHSTAAGGGTEARGPRLDRPRIDTGADQEAWNTFLRRWDAFRVGSGVGDSMASVQLLQCASEELSERLLKAIPWPDFSLCHKRV